MECRPPASDFGNFRGHSAASPESAPPPLHDVVVDLGVEEDEEEEGNDAEDEQPGPVVVDGVHGVRPHLGHLQRHLVPA